MHDDSRTVVLFSGGGTGGHLYPALALAAALVELRPDVRPFFVGADRGLKRLAASLYELEEEAPVSDEQKATEPDESTTGDEDVAAHYKGNVGYKGGTPGAHDEEGVDVEAHYKGNVGYKGGTPGAQDDDDDNDVEAHYKGNVG